MNVNDFSKGVTFVLKWEGGYTQDPDDAGGATNWGISQRAHPELDIKNLQPFQALEIYKNEYWLGAGCDALGYPMNVVVFDSAVNCGVSKAKEWLRKSTTPDEIIELRKEYYLAIVKRKPTQQKFLKGWLNRLGDLSKLISS